MLFNSIEFIVFLVLIFLSYWLIFQNQLKYQNLLLIASSYLFYGWWDFRFLSLIAISTFIDYFIGQRIYTSEKLSLKRLYLGVSIISNLGILGFFKYYNFFIDSWMELLNSIGYENQNLWTLSIVLPVGISFYTFQTMSYSLDIYNQKLTPSKDLISFAAFVSFFPQLVAGPIERARNLLPQMLAKRNFSYSQSVEGLRLILWGMFKKVVIADSLAPLVDDIFGNYSSFGGGILWLGVLYFAIQIYCDFSGYSDIAIGCAKLFGFELMSNFKFPYFSRNIAEFWRRWHISLSSWFRDYLYIPLGGSKGSMILTLRNIFIVFVVSGLWHGANWTFVAWGFLHALLFVPYFLAGKNRKYLNEGVTSSGWLPSIYDLYKILSTFLLVMIAWVFFRCSSLTEAFEYLTKMFTDFNIPNSYRDGMIYVVVLVVFDWILRKNERTPLKFKHRGIRWASYLILSICIMSYFFAPKQSFIYFQF